MSVLIGLCSTCNNASTCAYRQRRGFDAICCELFDASGPNGHAAGVSTANLAMMAEASAADETQLWGLCVNCAHRHDCRMLRDKGAVWHCEEYE